MAETYLIEINQNDELNDIVRKVNTNFKNMFFAQTAKVNQANRATNKALEDEVANVRQDLQNDISQINQDMQSMEARLNQAIATAVGNATTALKAALTPPVGTMMYSSANPGNTYTGTTWTQVGQGTVLLSAGSSYTEGSKYKLADSTLSSGGTLFTASKLWKRTA